MTEQISILTINPFIIVILQQEKLIYMRKSSVSGCLEFGGYIGKVRKGTFSNKGNVPYLLMVVFTRVYTFVKTH